MLIFCYIILVICSILLITTVLGIIKQKELKEQFYKEIKNRLDNKKEPENDIIGLPLWIRGNIDIFAQETVLLKFRLKNLNPSGLSYEKRIFSNKIKQINFGDLGTEDRINISLDYIFNMNSLYLSTFIFLIIPWIISLMVIVNS